MCTLPDRSGCEGNGVFSSEDSDFEGSSGWEDKVINPLEHFNVEYKLIQLANKKVSLNSVFRKYNLTFETIYSPIGWNNRCSCPFSDHRDSSPSFGYNSQEDRFNCFGCNRSGRAVEFISYMENNSKIDVARNLIGTTSSLEDLSLLELERFDYGRLIEVLFDYADYVREFKRSHSNSKKAVDYAMAITWNLDVYLRQHGPFNTIILDDLEVRVSKLKEQFLAFGDSL